MILAIRTDKPEAELYLLSADGILVDKKWQAHRELADTLLAKIKDLLESNSAEYTDLDGIIVFTGRGSFTGLRIGTTVANALAYSHNIPIVSADGKDWIESGKTSIKSTQTGVYVVPQYDSAPNISTPKSKRLQLEDKPK